MAPKVPEAIGKYKVIARLAQGGMGAVYTAQHPTLERTVIIKKLTLRGNANIRERFKREAQIMMDLRNDAIVDVYDHFREGSFYYIVLEYVDGASLEQLIRDRRYLPDAVALVLFRDVCRGLAYAHERNVVHRDIKPANILISSDGEVKIVDFGIATIHGDDGNESELTREGMTLGTPSYMAPEQFQSTRSVDRRADVYSLGVVLYEMVTGKRPYPGTFSPEVIARIQSGRYRGPRAVNPKVTPFTAALIRRMLRPKPSRRFADLDRVIKRINRRFRIKAHSDNRGIIKRYLDDESPAAIPRRRSPLVPAALAVVGILLAVAVGWSMDRGYHHEIFQPREYGAAEVTVRILKEGRPSEGLTSEGRAPTISFIPIDSEPDVAIVSGVLPAAPDDETARFFIFRDRYVVPAGRYWIETNRNGMLHRAMTEIPPVTETRRSVLPIPGRGEDAYPVSVEFLDVPELPLSLSVRVRDANTGRILNDALLVSVFLNERWRPFTRFTARTLRTGTEYRFRMEHPDYLPREVTVGTAAAESYVVLDVEVEPKE